MAIDDIVHRHGKAIVSMDIAQIMSDLMPEAMMKLQQAAGGGSLSRGCKLLPAACCQPPAG